MHCAWWTITTTTGPCRVEVDTVILPYLNRARLSYVARSFCQTGGWAQRGGRFVGPEAPPRALRGQKASLRRLPCQLLHRICTRLSCAT